MGVHWKVQLLGGGSQKTDIEGGDCLKMGWVDSLFIDHLKGRLGKKGRGVDTTVHTMSTLCTLWACFENLSKCPLFSWKGWLSPTFFCRKEHLLADWEYAMWLSAVKLTWARTDECNELKQITVRRRFICQFIENLKFICSQKKFFQ